MCLRPGYSNKNYCPEDLIHPAAIGLYFVCLFLEEMLVFILTSQRHH